MTHNGGIKNNLRCSTPRSFRGKCATHGPGLLVLKNDTVTLLTSHRNFSYGRIYAFLFDRGRAVRHEVKLLSWTGTGANNVYC